MARQPDGGRGSSRSVPPGHRLAYAALLAGETLAASAIFWTAFPLFQRIASRSGQQLDTSVEAVLVAAAIFLQACYWTRYRRVRVWAPVHSPVLGHLLLFAGRSSFFFGSALFSAIVFRHVPQLTSLPPLAEGLPKAAGFTLILFSLFCYALEIERLGRAVEEAPPPV